MRWRPLVHPPNAAWDPRHAFDGWPSCLYSMAREVFHTRCRASQAAGKTMGDTIRGLAYKLSADARNDPPTGSAQEPTTPRRMKSTRDSRWYITIALGPTFKAGKAAQGLPDGSLDTRVSIYDARGSARRLSHTSDALSVGVNDASRP